MHRLKFVCPSCSNSLAPLFSQLQSLTSGVQTEGWTIPQIHTHTHARACTHTDRHVGFEEDDIFHREKRPNGRCQGPSVSRVALEGRQAGRRAHINCSCQCEAHLKRAKPHRHSRQSGSRNGLHLCRTHKQTHTHTQISTTSMVCHKDLSHRFVTHWTTERAWRMAGGERKVHSLRTVGGEQQLWVMKLADNHCPPPTFTRIWHHFATN